LLQYIVITLKKPKSSSWIRLKLKMYKKQAIELLSLNGIAVDPDPEYPGTSWLRRIILLRILHDPELEQTFRAQYS